MPGTGRVVNVTEHTAGSELAEAPYAGALWPSDALWPSEALWPSAATQLSVVDPIDFDPDGGYVTLVDEDGTEETVAYVFPDENQDVLDLLTPLSGTYAEGDPVYLTDQNGRRYVERWADVMEPQGVEALRIRVPHALVALLPMGIRAEGEEEQVTFAQDGTDHVVTDVLGKVARYHLDLDATDGDDDVVNWYHPDGHRIARIRALYNVADPNDNLVRITVNPDATLGGVSLDISDLDVSVQVADGVGGFQQRTILDYLGLSNFLLDNPWQNWTPTLSGWSANPASGVYRYKQVGQLVHLAIRQGSNGTSNAATKTISLPVTAATISGMRWESACAAVDNGTPLTTFSRARIDSGGTTVEFDKDPSMAAGGWTTSGGHRIVACGIVYEAA